LKRIEKWAGFCFQIFEKTEQQKKPEKAQILCKLSGNLHLFEIFCHSKLLYTEFTEKFLNFLKKT